MNAAAPALARVRKRPLARRAAMAHCAFPRCPTSTAGLAEDVVSNDELVKMFAAIDVDSGGGLGVEASP